jgi:hypothetical protein
MTNNIGQNIAGEDSYLTAHEVAPGYFLERIRFFEQKYQNEFRSWRDFLVAYTLGRTDQDNLDYDEWAFLCEHFMEELTQPLRPPSGCADFQEKPEINSGFSIKGGIPCLNLKTILIAWKRQSPTPTVEVGRKRLGQAQNIQ